MSHLKYGDNSIIARLYTREAGVKSFIVKGVHKSTAKPKIAYFQPLMVLDIVMETPLRSTLCYIKDAVVVGDAHRISGDIRKTSLALFISEVISKSIHEEEPNFQVFDFLENTISDLVKATDSLSSFHIRFLVSFSALLGFKPMNNYSESHTVFDLLEGKFHDFFPNHQWHLAGKESLLFSQIAEATEKGWDFPPIQSSEKLRLLSILLEYYKLHLTGMGQIKSFEVLQQVFS